MNKILLLTVLSLILTNNSFTQGTAGESAKYEYMFLIDMPTAGILEKGFVDVTTDIMADGVFIAYLNVGVFKNLSFGISYGGSNVISRGSIDWYKWPGINVRVRLLNESSTLPAITIGFDSQGKGKYFDSENRYTFKSPGFFAGTSKNFGLWGFLSLHATGNYSLENSDGDNFVNLMVGLEKTVGSQVSFILEYNFALNDNNGDFGDGKGYLNAGLRWSVGNGFTLELDFRDLLENSLREDGSPDRGLRINYIQAIF